MILNLNYVHLLVWKKKIKINKLYLQILPTHSVPNNRTLSQELYYHKHEVIFVILDSYFFLKKERVILAPIKSIPDIPNTCYKICPRLPELWLSGHPNTTPYLTLLLCIIIIVGIDKSHGDIWCGDWEFDYDLRSRDCRDQGLRVGVWAELQCFLRPDSLHRRHRHHSGCDAHVGRLP